MENETLKTFLDAAVAAFDHRAQREHDPVSIPWEYDRNEDREVVAFITAALSYGRVSTFKPVIRNLLEPFGDRPSESIRDATFDEISDAVGDFQYRMTFRDDAVDFMVGISRTLQNHDSLFDAYDQTDDHLQNSSALVQTVRENRERKELSRGLRYLTVDPLDGSTAKRMQLFFRWVIREADEVDFGIWDVPPNSLIAPIDTHTARLWRYVGLATRKTVDLKFAMQVSEGLREIRQDDPLIYDFPICHLGISRRCIHKKSEDHCPGCPIESICTL